MLEHYNDIDTKREKIKKIETTGIKWFMIFLAELNKHSLHQSTGKTSRSVPVPLMISLII